MGSRKPRGPDRTCFGTGTDSAAAESACESPHARALARSAARKAARLCRGVRRTIDPGGRSPTHASREPRSVGFRCVSTWRRRHRMPADTWISAARRHWALRPGSAERPHLGGRHLAQVVLSTETTTESQKGGPATASLGPIKATLLSSAWILEGCRRAPLQSGAYRADQVVVSGMAGAAA